MNSITTRSALLLLIFAGGFVHTGFVQGSTGVQVPEAWINEFHYDDVGADSLEFVEIAVTGPVDPERLAVVLYNGSPTQLKVYGTHALSTFEMGADEDGIQLYARLISGLQNGPDALAICYDGDSEAGFETLVSSGVTPQFISYEGAFVPVDGCAAGRMATDVGVEETSTTPEGSSIGLEGGGASYDDFSWTSMPASTPGTANTGQTFGPLAVRMGELRLVVEHRDVRIEWTTISERDHAGFYVERLVSAGWVNLGFVASRGSEAGAQYTFVDRDVPQLPATYRLRLVATDGSSEYGHTAVAPATGSPMLGTAHPNPARSASQFLVTAPHQGRYRVTLHDVLGREIAELFSATLESGASRLVTIETASLSPGAYFYRIRSDRGASAAGRLTVVR